nr:zinc finger, CCHC-type [Tanacetum cinerariifolium]
MGGSYYLFPFLFFPSGRIAKLRNDILMFQQHQGESLSEAWTNFKDLLQKVPHHGIDHCLQVQIFNNHVTLVTRQTIDQSTGGKLHDKNAKESWALLEDLALYDNEMVPMTLSTAWKIPNKPLLNVHPRVPTKHDVKDKQEMDEIRSKPGKNEKRGEAGRSQK